MKFTFSASIDIPDVDKWLAEVKKEVRATFMKAAQKFLLAAVPRVPIWTGMARGAFRNMEDIVGKVTNDATAASGVRIRTTQGKGGAGRGGGSKITAPYRKGWYYQPPSGARVARTPQAGRQFTTDPLQIFDITGVSLATGRTSFYIRYDINITYFDLFDEKKWGSFKAGTAALEAYVKDNLTLPELMKFTTRKIVGKTQV